MAEKKYSPGDKLPASVVNRIIENQEKLLKTTGVDGVQVSNEGGELSISPARSIKLPTSSVKVTVASAYGDGTLLPNMPAVITGSYRQGGAAPHLDPIFTVDRPQSAEDDIKTVCIPVDSLQGDESGKAHLLGAVMVRVKSPAGSEAAGLSCSLDFAESEAWLVTSATRGGDFEILWEEAPEADAYATPHWAIILMGGGGGASYEVAAVGELPSVPESGMLEVYWDSTIAPSTGDDQVWRVYAGQSFWYPTEKSTNHVGTPGS